MARDDRDNGLSPRSRRGFGITLWVWIPAICIIGIILWLVIPRL